MTGSELLDGRVQESNSRALISRLVDSGFVLSQMVVCDDLQESIVKALQFLSQISDAVIVSGGLGPTSDDLTREAISNLTGSRLELNQTALDRMKNMFAARRRKMDPSNIKQAMFPQGAEIIDNPAGTALGFMSRYTNPAGGCSCLLIALPGVPAELETMLDGGLVRSLKAALRRSEPDRRTPAQVFRIFGLAESDVGSQVMRAQVNAPLSVAFCTKFPEVQVVFKGPFGSEMLLEQAAERARTLLGREFIFSEDLALDFRQVLHQLLLEANITLAVAESCTGGRISTMLTSQAGASRYFIGAAVTYANQSKVACLGVDGSVLEEQGAVSPAVAKSMAAGARLKFGTAAALSVTGIAGPEGGSAEKPVGLFYVGYSSKEETIAYKCFYSASRERIQNFAAWTALDILRRRLLGYEVLWEMV